jgi:hypothetical protein
MVSYHWGIVAKLTKVGDIHLKPTSRAVTFSVTTRPKLE